MSALSDTIYLNLTCIKVYDQTLPQPFDKVIFAVLSFEINPLGSLAYRLRRYNSLLQNHSS